MEIIKENPVGKSKLPRQEQVALEEMGKAIPKHLRQPFIIEGLNEQAEDDRIKLTI